MMIVPDSIEQYDSCRVFIYFFTRRILVLVLALALALPFLLLLLSASLAFVDKNATSSYFNFNGERYKYPSIHHKPATSWAIHVICNANLRLPVESDIPPMIGLLITSPRIC